MADAMTPSKTITAQQIGKIQGILGSALRKSRLPSGPTQQVIEHSGDTLVRELMEVIRQHVEAAAT